MPSFQTFDQILQTGKKYKIIYADPPWEYDDKALAGNRGARCKYQVMSTDEIKKLPISQIADKDCILFLWATFPQLPDALDLIKVWGFTYKTKAFTWVKKNKNGTIFQGMGNWTRANDEIVLLATKGKPKRKDAGISSIVFSDIQEHSKKPDVIRKKILQLVGDLQPRIELFSRINLDAENWDTFGNDHKLNLKPLELFT